MTRVYIVRHCQAEGNVNGRFQGHWDGKITEEGQAQLQKLAARFQDIPLDAAYSSDLQRAYLTAKAVADTHGLSVEKDARFREINGGGYEGLRWEELSVKYPEASDLWEHQPHLCVCPDGESTLSCHDRMMEALCEKVKLHPNQSILIASHGCAIRTLTCSLLGWDFSRLNDVPWCGNTAVTTMDVDEFGNFSNLDLGDNSHLTGERFFLKF